MKLLKLNKLKLSQLSIRSFKVFFYRARTVRKKLVLFFAPIVLILGPIVIMALYNASNADAAWYHSGWEYRKKIVIDQSKVSGSSDLTDFPVLISITDSHVKSLAQSDGDDITFTSSDGTTKLSHEIEKFNSTTGQLLVWVKVSTLDYDDDTVIYMYYGNSTTSSQQSTTGVWDSNFKGVWHFPETSGAHQDSTTNNNDSTTVNVTTQGSATGKIDGADDYASGNEVVVDDNNSLDITSDFTLEAWVKADTLPTADNYSSIIYKGANGNYLLELYDNGDIEVGFHNGSSWVVAASTTNPISTGTFYHIVATFDNATDTLKGYVNAVEYSSNTSASGNPAANTSTLTFGENTYAEVFDGVIDEVRISNTKRSTDWITTEYNNQNDPATFYSVGGAEQKDKPILHLKFDEGQGTTANDSSGNSNSGTISGAVWQQQEMCVINKCLRFDGSDDYIATSDFYNQESGSYTLSAWIKPSTTLTTASSSQIFFDKTTGAANYEFGWLTHGTGSNKGLCFYTYNSGDSYICYQTTLSAGNWYHVSLTHTQSTATIYLNGTMVATAGVSVGANSVVLQIGRRAVNDFYFNGFIDEPKVYNYARSADQLKSDYNAGAAILGAKDQDALSNGLVGYWKMDEASWTNDCSTESVIDASGNSNHGESCPASTGPTGGAVGKYGNAGSFDGTNDVVSVDDADNLDITEYGTFSSWIYLNSTGVYHNIIQKHPAGGSGYAMYIDNSNRLAFYEQSSGTSQTHTSSSTLSSGSWYFITVTKSGTSIRLYINGSIDSTLTSTISSIPANTLALGIGSRTSDQASPINGKIDESRIYNRALSPREVAQLYSFAPGPVGYWNFEDKIPASAATDEIKDKSGNGLHGNLLGSGKYAAGKYGAGLRRNNVAQESVEISDNVLLKPTGAITVEVWYKSDIDGSSLNNEVLIEKGEQYRLMFEDNNVAGCTNSTLCFAVSTGAAGEFEGASYAKSNIVANTWYHIVGTFDGATIRLYLNGVLVGTATPTNSTMVTDTDVLCLGDNESTDCSNKALYGYFDEYKIYNYARTPSQIIEDMNGGHPIGGSPTASQVGYWKFDEGTGTTANNSGNGGATLNGTISGSTWSTSGKSKNALDFDNSDDSVSLGVNSIFEFGSDQSFSVSAWIKPDTNDGFVFFYGDTDDQWYALQYENSGLFTFDVDDDVTKSSATTATSYSTGSWYHVVGVRDRPNDILRIYVNGKLVDTTTDDTGSVNNSTQRTTYIGRKTVTGAGGQYYDGLIDEVKVYNTALSDSDVKIDYNAGKSIQLGVLGTDASGNPSNSTDRAFCPPGDTTATCGPIAYFPFEEKSGVSTADKTANGNTGTLTNGPAWINGKIGGALSFDGSNDVVDIGSAAILDDLSALTFSSWIYVRSDGEVTQRVFNKTDNATAGWGIAIKDSSDEINFYVRYDGGTNLDCDGTTPVPISSPNSSWTHVTVTWDGTSTCSGVKIYINGKSSGVDINNSGTGNRPSDASFNARLGNGNSTSNSYDGNLDEVKIYNYVRSASQVAWDYNNGKPIAHYKFDECTGSTAYDSSGNNLHGTIAEGAGGTTIIGDCNNSATSIRYLGRVGKRNYGLNFDKVDDQVQLGTASLLSDLGPMTISAWINPEDEGENTNGRIMSSGQSGASAGFWTLHIDGTYALRFEKDFSTTDILKETAYNVLTAGTWQHVAMTWDGTTSHSGVKIYINGIESAYGVTNQNAVGTAVSDSALEKFIGNRGGDDRTFNGIIDDVRVYNYPLTAQQVKSVMNDGAVRWGPATGAP